MPAHPLRPEIRLLDGRFYADDPQRCFAWLREHVPVYRDATGDPPFGGVTLYADVMAISRDARTFSSAQGTRPSSPPIPSMISTDDPLLRVTFEEMLARAPGLELVPDAPAAVRPANFVVGLEELQVRVG
jgi:cytochrome P450